MAAAMMSARNAGMGNYGARSTAMLLLLRPDGCSSLSQRLPVAKAIRRSRKTDPQK